MRYRKPKFDHPQKISETDWNNTPESVKNFINERLQLSNQNLQKEFRERTNIIIILVLDTVFLIICVLVQWLASKYVYEKVKLVGIDQWSITLLQIIFAISTDIAVLSYVVKDVVKIIMKAINEIKSERELLKQREEIRELLKETGR